MRDAPANEAAARALVHKAMREGALGRPERCESCAIVGAMTRAKGPGSYVGRPAWNLVWHHHRYDRPLDVIALCRPCHGEIHGGSRPEPRTGRMYAKGARRPYAHRLFENVAFARRYGKGRIRLYSSELWEAADAILLAHVAAEHLAGDWRRIDRAMPAMIEEWRRIYGTDRVPTMADLAARRLATEARVPVYGPMALPAIRRTAVLAA